MNEGLLFVVAGAWLLSPVVFAVLLSVEARRRRELGDGLGVLEAKLGRLERAVATLAAQRREAPSEAATSAELVRPSTSPALSVGPATPARSRRAQDERTESETVAGKAVHPERSAEAEASARSRRAASPQEQPLETILPRLPPLPPAPPPPPDEPWRFDWERLVGVKLYSWLAGVAVAVAAVSFTRYSVEHGWLVAPVRMAIGLAVGVALLAGAELRVARSYRVTAQALAAGGAVTLFATFWAAHALWHLVPALATFGLLALVAAVAVLLAVRRDALVVAVLGLAGGFATPWLLSTGEDRPIGLFSYLLLLNVALSWVARKKRWPLLSAIALTLTAVYQAGWVLKFLDAPGELPIAVGVFLVFAALGFVVLALASRRGLPVPPLARWTAALGAIPPVLFGLYAVSQPALWERWPLLFGFVALLAAGLAAVATWQGPEWLHLLGAGAAVATMIAFAAGAPPAVVWPGLGLYVLLLAAIALAAAHLALRLGKPFRAEARFAVFGAPLLFVVLAMLAARGAGAAPWSFAAVAILLVAGCGLSAALRGDGPLAAAAALLATAALTALTRATPYGDQAGAARQLPILLAAPGLGLVALAVPLLARRRGRTLRLPVERGPPLEVFALGGHFVVIEMAARGFSPLEGAAFLGALAVLQLALVADALRRRAGAVLLAGAAGALLAVWVAASHELGPTPAAAAIATIVATTLLVAWRLGSDRLALAAGLAGAAAILGASQLDWAARDVLVAAAPPWLLALGYALARGARGRSERLAYAGAIVASAAFFLAARAALLELGAAPFIGALPVVQALLLVPHLVLLVRGRGPGGAAPPRGTLALVAGAALAFVTVAIPLQLDKQWISIGWALEAAALAWLWRRIAHRGLLLACAGLLGAVLVRLVLNPEILHYHPKSATPIWNWYLYAYLTAAAAAFVAARLLAGREDRLGPRWPRLSGLAAAQGAILLFALVNIEIADFFSTGPRLRLRIADFFSSGPSLEFRLFAGLGQDLTYTIAWALFAIGLLAAGVALASRPARAAAIALLSATVLKAFLHDLARLEGLYRVGSFVGLAVSLALVAVVLQRFVLRPAEGRTDGEAT
ncbi:MAG TPA: DUF2339 domain-containing protein [Anaeromyxobacter sp.]